MSDKQVHSALDAVESALSDLVRAFRAYEHALSCSGCNPMLSKLRKLFISEVYHVLWAVIRLPKAYLLTKDRSDDKTSMYITFEQFKEKFPDLPSEELAAAKELFDLSPDGKALALQMPNE